MIWSKQLKIQVILGSTRPGRVVERVGKWVADSAEQVDEFEVEVVDLADYSLPFFDEAISPRYNPNRTINPAATKWLAKLSEADGYIFITPEYNHSITGVLKNALDYVTYELAKKPVAVVSYGSVGGARAAEHLKAILIESKAAIVPEAVTLIGQVTQILSEDGVLDADLAKNLYGPAGAIAQTLSELAWWTQTLKAGREELALA